MFHEDQNQPTEAVIFLIFLIGKEGLMFLTLHEKLGKLQYSFCLHQQWPAVLATASQINPEYKRTLLVIYYYYDSIYQVVFFPLNLVG